MKLQNKKRELIISSIKFFLIGALILILDQWTKFYFKGKNLTVIRDTLYIKYAENPGVIFGFFKSNIIFLYIFPIIIILIICYLFYKNELDWMSACFISIGLLGNVISRFVYGFVIDWIFIPIYPAWNVSLFNIADASLILGVIFALAHINRKK
ncbi:MAG: signal peptidase II [Candidatus Nanoarchaeia archaeon]|nr:signal peptidase II [Candidatus Nanoarchaeia archaeon]MDD5588238.1 signal peptidase II [Candidatus Nanoarchaeia archaeon]